MFPESTSLVIVDVPTLAASGRLRPAEHALYFAGKASRRAGNHGRNSLKRGNRQSQPRSEDAIPNYLAGEGTIAGFPRHGCRERTVLSTGCCRPTPAFQSAAAVRRQRAVNGTVRCQRSWELEPGTTASVQDLVVTVIGSSGDLSSTMVLASIGSLNGRPAVFRLSRKFRPARL